MDAIYKSCVINDAWHHELTSIDYFFLAIGSDFRAYESLRIAEQNGVIIKNVILFQFEERKEDVLSRVAQGAEQYKKIKYPTTIIDCSIQNPSGALKSTALSIIPTDVIAVDISCFTKPFFFTIFNWLKTIYKIGQINVFYTEPKNYLFNKGLYNAYHSSFGPITVEEIPSFTGNNSNKKGSLLVIMLGFDGDLSAEIDENVAPKKTILVNGFPSYSPNFKDISLISNEKLVNTGGNKLVYSRSTNPFDTYNLLLKIKEDNPDLFINITPIGTKPMALGVCLFALHNPDVRIIYPMPEKFENVTSSDAWCTWYYDIPLSEF
jgi:hypothetical protein